MRDLPLSTGEVARLLRVRPYQLQDKLRRDRIVPAPPVHMGRRWWDCEHVAAAAALFASANGDKPDDPGPTDAA